MASEKEGAMAEEKPSLENRLEQLTAQVQALAGRVEQLAAKLELEEPARTVAAAP
jgi:outer membrane murein-binding lipoprotein Lpp